MTGPGRLRVALERPQVGHSFVVVEEGERLWRNLGNIVPVQLQTMVGFRNISSQKGHRMVVEQRT